MLQTLQIKAIGKTTVCVDRSDKLEEPWSDSQIVNISFSWNIEISSFLYIAVLANYKTKNKITIF